MPASAIPRALLFLCLAGAAFAEMGPREIVARSVQKDDRDFKLTSDYTYLQRSVIRELDGKGRVKTTRVETREVMFIGGRPYRRLVERDGKPLPPAEESRERAKMDRAISEAAKLSPEQRQARLDDYRKKRARDREFARDIPDAFTFQLLRDDTLDARPAYVIAATPNPAYRGPHRDLLSKMKGTLWIDKADYHWARLEAETLDTISFGLFLARLGPGAHLQVESVRVNNEIWLPRRVEVKASARLALLKKFNIEQETAFSNYRKFQTDSKIVVDTSQ